MTAKKSIPKPNGLVVAPPDRGVDPDDTAVPAASLAASGGRLVLARRLADADEDILALVRSALDLGAAEAAADASPADLEAAAGRRLVVSINIHFYSTVTNQRSDSTTAVRCPPATVRAPVSKAMTWLQSIGSTAG